MLRDFQAYQIAKGLHHSCKGLRVAGYHQDQLLRASSSVVLNLAEGSAKRSPLEQRRFYGIALASLRECEAILDMEEISDPTLLSKLDSLGAILYTLSLPPEDRNPSPNRTDRDRENPNLHDNQNRTGTGIRTGPDPDPAPPLC
jgi:four helix bundle protein